ncbi:MAG: DUF4982 domain-containing protein [Bacteroidales bacterium]|nr:DUF4982 domain-containing protein [Bacteroidales bacterium]
MKRRIICSIFLALSVCASAQYQRQKGAEAGTNVPWESISQVRRQLFNFDWKFRLGPLDGAAAPELDDSAWRVLDLPHDFQFEQPWLETAKAARGFKPMVEGWYRKHFTADPSWQGRRVCLVFDGIMFVSDVYLNGTRLGSGEYGYVGYEVDITDQLRFDVPNVVAVYASSGPENGSRWYTGAGIFRDVHLEVKNPTHIARNGVYVTTPEVSAARAGVALQVEVDGYQGHDARIRARILAPDGAVAGTTEAGFPEHTLRTRVEVPMPELVVEHPQLWSPDSPSLYLAEVEVWADGMLVDRCEEHFGIRRIEFTQEQGFLLNGEKIFLHGVSDHHDLGALGAASYDTGIERLFRQLKAFGFNVVRCSHNPYSERFTEIADRMGMLIVDELIDKWSDDEYWGGREPFTHVWYKLIPEWIKRDRNSPSVILWSLGNELQIRDAWAGFPTEDWGVTTYRIFDTLVKRYDDTRKTTVAMFPARAGAIYRERPEYETYLVPPELACVTEVASFNYRWKAYPAYLEHAPHLIIFQSEATTRELLGPYYGMDQEKMVGLGYWGAIEYWGESNGWPKKGYNYSYFSHTMEAYPQAWLMKSAFIPEEPVVRVAIAEGSEVIEEWNDELVGQQTYTSTWNFPEGSKQQVAVFSNAEEVELIVNGKRMGRKANDNTEPGTQHIVTWKDVPYGRGGSIEAVGYTAGREVARHRVETAGKAVALRVEAETPDSWLADGMDLQYLRVFAVDRKGRVVPGFSEPVTVTVDGAAVLLTTDNGDHYTDELFYGVDTKQMRGGFLQVILRSKRGDAGPVRVNLSSPSLRKTLTLQTLAAE